MLDHTQFHAVFPSEGPKPYDQNGVRAIETFRKTFDGVLFIDRVLKALEIGDQKSYPPRGDSGLRALHHSIVESKVSTHHKLSVFYYMLLDYDDVRGARSHLADSLAEETGLPQKYRILMRGLWHMDRKEFKSALEHLAHPSLPTEFADATIVTLVRHADVSRSSAGGSGPPDYTLALAYYHTAQPVLRTAEALDLLYGALARTSVTEALYFSRKYQTPYPRQQFFEKLVASVLELPESKRGKELVSLPLDRTEETWLRDYLTTGDGRKSKNAKSILQMRGVVTGRAKAVVNLNGLTIR
ncbi:protein ELYS [Diplogelasinospora grovesii]|uniref:Protein ELYS n=1 Tax=Diplogelasinospora grovesii TaxID=303347 RepID=A0AAN6S5M1_9PEZI|nr:protein ELYS [Diplogelasinospora grovesii]